MIMLFNCYYNDCYLIVITMIILSTCYYNDNAIYLLSQL